MECGKKAYCHLLINAVKKKGTTKKTGVGRIKLGLYNCHNYLYLIFIASVLSGIVMFLVNKFS